MSADDVRSMSGADLVEQLERMGIRLPAQVPEADAFLIASREPQTLPRRFELRLEERPFVTFVRGDESELTLPLDRRIADALRTRFAASPIETPRLFCGGGGESPTASLEAAAEALRALERDDLEVRRLRVLRQAFLRSDLASLDSTLAALLDALLELTGAERGAVFLVEEGEARARYFRDRAHGSEAPVLPSRVLERALERQVVFTSEDVAGDAELYRDTVEELRIKSLLVAPWVRNGKVEALCYLDRRLSSSQFSPEMVDLFAALAEDLWRLLETALDREAMAARIARLEATEHVGEFRASTPAMTEILSQVRRAATTRQPILILGETGTGKTLLAEGVHRLSLLAHRPFVHVRLSEITENLFESEMFGHERGAFTGATAPRPGLLAEADGGTLFLDEVGRLTPALQGKLLGALESEGAGFHRVGGRRQAARFRMVAATSVDLAAAMREGTFLADLWWRLSAGLVVTLPPLRERAADVPLLVDHLLRQIAVGEGAEPVRLERDALDLLLEHRWPGNVRELRGVLQRAFWGSLRRDPQRTVIQRRDIDFLFAPKPVAAADPYERALEAMGYGFPQGAGFNEEIDFLRAARIRQVLAAANMNEAEAARRLGCPPSTLRSQMRRLGIAVAKEVNGK